ncbi:MAG: YdeI/OmpD-associated family protein, partial [Actinobacteria bacterium]|nr:YdeI/OmpD-associated family protein [Actinomycetota bacterium]
MSEITETFIARDRVEWRAWLTANHSGAREIWLLVGKKGSPEPSVTYDEAVEEALCFGWIDGQSKRWHEHRYAVRFTPRRPGSVWADSNKARVERLITAGRMTAAGLAVVEAARAHGDWDRLPPARDLDEVPADLQAALGADRAAGAGWGALPPSSRRRYVGWIIEARRPATRERR